MQEFISWMRSTPLAHIMADTGWGWPLCEVLHFVGMSVLFGSVFLMDLRLLGLFRRSISIRAVHSLAPWAAAGFAINVLTGIAFLSKDADRLLPNLSFQLKMLCVLVAGLNFLLFVIKFGRQATVWSDDVDPPPLAKAIGIVSLTAWTLVIWGGRMIPVFGTGG